MAWVSNFPFRSNVMIIKTVSLTKHSFCCAPNTLLAYRAEESKHDHKRAVNLHVVHASPSISQLCTRYNAELTDQAINVTCL